MKFPTASALLFIFLLSLSVSAQTFPQPQDKYVNDFASFLDSASVSELRGLLSELERNTTAEVVVVTVPTTAPETPSQYRTELFNKWKIGNAEKDNGLLILYVVKEKRIEAEVGYGLEGILPDSKVGRILDDFYVPYRDRNETAKGIVLATREFVRVINENAEEVRAGNAGRNTIMQDDAFYILLNLLPFIIFILVFIAAFAASRPRKCQKCGEKLEYYDTEGDYEIYKCKNGHVLKKRKRRYGGVVIAGGFGGGGSWGGGGGGGGFGGGGSGGGGAGR